MKTTTREKIETLMARYHDEAERLRRNSAYPDNNKRVAACEEFAHQLSLLLRGTP